MQVIKYYVDQQLPIQHNLLLRSDQKNSLKAFKNMQTNQGYELSIVQQNIISKHSRKSNNKQVCEFKEHVDVNNSINEDILGKVTEQIEEIISQHQEINSFKHQTKQNHYKPQIDGLRTVAVMTVIIFHAWPDLLPGGYIGVDIFFVISGYLISQIILKQARKGKFSYMDFYSRRIRRIYPALTLVMLFVFLVVYKEFFYSMQILTFKKMAAATLFSANIESMTKQSGYFSVDQTNNPLLHLWSLGVQEQFYIVWPLVISLIVSKFSQKGLQILVLFTLASFTFNVIIAFTLQPKVVYYFPVGRFWEMAIGGLLTYHKVSISNEIVANVLSTIGIILVVCASFFIDQKFTFPGFWALIPTFCAAFIILAGQKSLINEKILSSRPFVIIGKISYPFYLWHWPLLVFSRRFYPPGSTSIFANPLIPLILSFVLSFMTYELIQKPIRYKKGKIVVFFLFLIMTIIGLASGYFILTMEDELTVDSRFYLPGSNDYVQINGKKLPNSSKNPFRQKPTAQKVSIARWQILPFPVKPVNKKSKYFLEQVGKTMHSITAINEGQLNQLFVLGDSHAGILFYRFYQLYLQSKHTFSSSFPTVVSYMAPSKPFLPRIDSFEISIAAVEKHRPKRVLLVNYWIFYLEQNEQGLKDIQDFAQGVKRIVDLGAEVFVATFHNAQGRMHPINTMDQNGPIEENIRPYKLSEFRERYKYLLVPFQKSVNEAGGKLFDFADNLCWQDTCHVLLPSGVPIMSDPNHYCKQYLKYWFSSVDFSVQF